MEQELKILFIQICKALGMEHNDPLMYLYVNDSIDQLQKDFLAIFNKMLANDAYIAKDLAQDENARSQWLHHMQIQAVHIFSEFLNVITITAPLQKEITIRYPSERQKTIQQSIEKLLRYANTLKSKKSDISIDDLTMMIQQHKNKDHEIASNSEFSSAINAVFKKNMQVINLQAKNKYPELSIDSRVNITKAALDASQLFLMSLSCETVYGYSKELLDMVGGNIKLSSTTEITPQQQEIFFSSVQQRLDIADTIDNISGLIVLMEKFNVTNIKDLLTLEYKKDALSKRFLSILNMRPQLSEIEKNDLASEPVLLFNVLIKLVVDNLTENLNDGALEKGYRDKYFSSKGLEFSKQTVYKMYESILKVLDYRLHVNDQQYAALNSATYPRPRTTPIKSSSIIFTSKLSKNEIEAMQIYKEVLRDLADYANFVQTAASEAATANKTNNNSKLAVHIKELQDISRQLSTVTIADNAKVTKPMGRTLIQFTVKVMAISRCVKDEMNKTSPGIAQWFAEHNLGFISKIINAVSRLCTALMKIFGSAQPIAATKPLDTTENENKRQKVINKVQKIRF